MVILEDGGVGTFSHNSGRWSEASLKYDLAPKQGCCFIEWISTDVAVDVVVDPSSSCGISC